VLRRLLPEAFSSAVELVWSKAAGSDTMTRLVSQEMNLGLAGDERGDAFLPSGETWESVLRDAFAVGVTGAWGLLGPAPRIASVYCTPASSVPPPPPPGRPSRLVLVTSCLSCSEFVWRCEDHASERKCAV
jgi:hypothetical protein